MEINQSCSGSSMLNLLENCFAGYIDGLGDAVEQGLVKAVGVSNYSGLFSFAAAPNYLGCT